MTDLPSETRKGFAPWHQEQQGFDLDGFRVYRENTERYLSDIGSERGWITVPVTITITATETGLTAAPQGDT